MLQRDHSVDSALYPNDQLHHVTYLLACHFLCLSLSVFGEDHLTRAAVKGCGCACSVAIMLLTCNLCVTKMTVSWEMQIFCLWPAAPALLQSWHKQEPNATTICS